MKLMSLLCVLCVGVNAGELGLGVNVGEISESESLLCCWPAGVGMLCCDRVLLLVTILLVLMLMLMMMLSVMSVF